MLWGLQDPDEETVGKDWDDIKLPAPATSTEHPATPPLQASNAQNSGNADRRTPLFDLSELLIEGKPVLLGRLEGSDGEPDIDRRSPEKRSTSSTTDGMSHVGYGGHTNLSELNRLGMYVALRFELHRLQTAGWCETTVFDLSINEVQLEVRIFDVSSPALIERSRTHSPIFRAVLDELETCHGLSRECPGCDIISLCPEGDRLDRLIELKSSGVEARFQEMSWNEWKSAAGSLRQKYFLYLVGNLRSDLSEPNPFIRTIQNPFGQLAAEPRDSQLQQRKVQLAVHRFQKAEQLNLGVVSKHLHQ